MKRLLTPLIALALALSVGLSPAVAKTPPGPSSLATAPIVDAHLGYQKQKTCSPSAKPGTAALMSLLIKTWGGSSWGISRSCGVGGTSEHKEGRALDWHKDSRYASHRRAVADAMKWLTANNGEVAYRLGIMYIIWDQKIWSIYYQELGWRKMSSRGSRTANHKDHVHISLSWDGAMKQTSWWTGVPVTQPLNSRCGVSGARACLPTIRRASDVWESSSVPVPPFLPAPWRIPGIGGSPQVDRTLTAVPGNWVPSGSTLSYQWEADGSAIPGATGQQYVVQAGTLGKSIRVRVRALTSGGTPFTRTSDGMTDVVKASFRHAVTPLIIGPRTTGSVLSLELGAWRPMPRAWAYQWYRGSTKIRGATKSTYQLTGADAGKAIRVQVRGWTPGYNARNVYSARTAPIAKGSIPIAPTPGISGTMLVGQTLTMRRGTWGPAPVATRYQWYRDDEAIPGATGWTYQLTAADLGAVIRVRVRGVKSGYLDTYKWSPPGPAVTDPPIGSAAVTTDQPPVDSDGTDGPTPTPTPTPTPSPTPTPTPSPTPTPTPSPTPVETTPTLSPSPTATETVGAQG